MDAATTNETTEEVTFDAFAGELSINRLPDTEKLKNTEFHLHFESGVAYLVFDFADGVRWQGLPLGAELGNGQGAVRAVEAAPELYFVELVLPDDSQQGAIIVLDQRNQDALLVHSVRDASRHAAGLASNFTQGFHPASLQAGQPSRAVETRDLIGKRVLNVYSEETAVEHIYINSQWYTYHINGGIRHGDCDCDEVSYYKLREDVYLVAFRETALDVAIVLVLDTEALRSTGVATGREGDNWFRLPIGSHMHFLSHTDYPEGYAPA